MNANVPHARIIEGNRKKTKFAISKVGTVNIELALMGVPTICMHRMASVDSFLALHLFKICLPHYSLVNILLQKRIFPEYFLG